MDRYLPGLCDGSLVATVVTAGHAGGSVTAHPGVSAAAADGGWRLSGSAGFVLDGESTLLANKDDPHSVKVFDPSIKGETDRFAYRFVRR